MKLIEQLRRASRQLAPRLEQVSDPAEIGRQLAAALRHGQRIATTDWSAASAEQRAEATAQIREVVIEGLIPAASAVSMCGLPGILAYTPCQLAGALALGHVQTNEGLGLAQLKTAAQVVLLGKLGQLVWVNLADLIKPLSPPLVSLALLPFVQGWTEAILDLVEHAGQPEGAEPAAARA